MSFAKFNVESQIFFRSASGLTYGLVNLKPIVPGHVLLIPRRVVPRIADLEPAEVSDLFLSVQRVAGTLVRPFSPSVVRCVGFPLSPLTGSRPLPLIGDVMLTLFSLGSCVPCSGHDSLTAGM